MYTVTMILPKDRTALIEKNTEIMAKITSEILSTSEVTELIRLLKESK